MARLTAAASTNFLRPPVTETIGRTSADPEEFVIQPDHLVRLVERHEISAPVPRTLTEDGREDVWAACDRRAREWAAAEGLAIELNYFHNGPNDSADDDEPLCAGVWWEVVVGNAVPTPPAYPHGSPRSQLTWTWSARWLHWAAWFRSMQARDRAEARAFPTGPDDAKVVKLSAYQATPPWDRHRTVRELSAAGAGASGRSDISENIDAGGPDDVSSEMRSAGPWAE